jgi:flagellar FliL protein
VAAAAAVPAADSGAAAPPKKGKKKLLMMLVVGVLVLLVAGAGAVFMLKKKAAAHDAEDGDEASGAPAAHKVEKPDLKHPPVFLPLDAFVVNLADKDADRYAQIGITLEVEDPKFGELLKVYMPAIRNAILLILAQKSSADLLDRPGKEQLAGEIQREAARVMGFDVDEPEAPAKAAAKDGAKEDAKAEGDDEDKPKAKKKRRANAEPNPIKHVHFSNFIIQ